MVKLRLPQVAAGVVLFLLCSGLIAQQSDDCCSLVVKAINAAERVKPNMTRSDIEKEFREDGGLSFSGESIYVYRPCPFIKVRVTFATEVPGKTPLVESPADVIRSVSQPYLEYPHND
jgi:hypothetical protein